MCSILNLPNEVLVKIFSYLSLRERNEAGLVCHKWLDITTCSKFYKKIVVFLSSKAYQSRINQKAMSPTYPNMMKVFAKTKRQFTDYRFVAADLNSKDVGDLWKNISKNVESLSINMCQNVSSLTVAKFLRSAPKLTTLEVTDNGVQVWSPSDFEKLGYNILDFRWSHNGGSFNEDKVVQSLYQIAPKLESFGFSANAEGQQKNKLTKKVCADFFRHYAKFLTKISVEEGDLPKHPLTKCMFECNMKAPFKLHTFHLNLSPNVDVNEMNKFLQTQQMLSELSLGLTPFTDETLKVVGGMKHLKTNLLAPLQPEIITDQGMQEFKNFQKIQKLYMSYFPNFSNQGLNLGLVKSDLSHLKILGMTGINYVTADAFQKILPRMTSLTALKIFECPKLMTNNLLQAIFQYLVNLEKLEMDRAEKVSSAGFYRQHHTGFRINRLRKLRTLSFEDFPKIDDSCLMTFKFPELIELNLSGCPQISLAGVKKVILNCPTIENLVLQNNQQIPMASVNEFAKEHLPRYKHVIMDEMPTTSAQQRVPGTVPGYIPNFPTGPAGFNPGFVPDSAEAIHWNGLVDKMVADYENLQSCLTDMYNGPGPWDSDFDDSD